MDKHKHTLLASGLSVHQYVGGIRTAGISIFILLLISLLSGSAYAGVPIYPGDNIQSVVDRYPNGTEFNLKAGVYLRQTILPKDNDSFIGDAGAVLDGQNNTSYAFIYDDSIRHPSNVTISGLTIQRYTTPNRRGAILGMNTRNWQVSHNEIRSNGWAGVECGPGMQVFGNYIHDNGSAGIIGYMATGTILDNNEVAYNNTSYLDPNTANGSSSGIKFFQSTNVIVRNNNVHNNYYAPGIWLDADNTNALIDNNYVWSNGWSGIVIEVSPSAIVRNNTIIGNGIGYGYGTPGMTGAGIFLSVSSNVQVYNNTVWYNQNGITGIEQNRGAGSQGTWYLRYNYVHDNKVTLFSGATGLVADDGNNTIFTTNIFWNNTYYLRPDGSPLEWNGISMNWFQWAQTHGPTEKFTFQAY